MLTQTSWGSYHSLNFTSRCSNLKFQSYIAILAVYNCWLLYYIMYRAFIIASLKWDIIDDIIFRVHILLHAPLVRVRNLKIYVLQSFLESMKSYNSSFNYKREETLKLRSPLYLGLGSLRSGGKWVLFFVDRVNVRLF